MSQAPNRYGGFSKCQAGTPTQKQKFNEQPLGALSLLRTVVPESLRHAGPKGLARARLLESVVGRAEQGEGLAMGWSRGVFPAAFPTFSPSHDETTGSGLLP